jgi:[ribosomal protein S5]-alanine N-acetyltransferase
MSNEPGLSNITSTGRLNLTLLVPADFEFIFSLLNSEGWIKYIGDRDVKSLDDAKRYTHKIIDTENLFYWVVRIKESYTPIGIISFLKRNHLTHYDLGFAMLPEYAGNGYAFEAAQKVLTTALQIPGFNTILATTLPGNKASISLLRKLGFVFSNKTEVENQDLHIYTISAG